MDSTKQTVYGLILLGKFSLFWQQHSV